MVTSRLVKILAPIVVMLLIPLVAMQFTNEVDWDLLDFVVAGFILLFIGIILDIVIRKVNNAKWRFALCIVVLIVLVLVWVELAVGILGTPLSGD